jgi:hypothetical protein
MESQSTFASKPPAYGTAGYTSSLDAKRASSGQKKQGTELLLVVIAVLILIVIAVYAVYGGKSGGGGGGGMPSLAPGVLCNSGSNGLFARLSTKTPTASGIAPPTGGSKIQAYPATDSSCVTESVCQSYCTGDKSCSFYTYDSSAQVGSKNCPVAGSVCTTYSGALPATVASGTTAFVTGGIPSSYLPSKEGFTVRENYVDRCGNLGSDGCPHLGDRFISETAWGAGDFGAAGCM